MATTNTDTERLARYGACSAEVRDWAERAGYENLRERIQLADAIHAQSVTTLTLLLAGLGGALTYAVKLLDGRSGLPLAAAGFAIYLVILAGLLLLKCIKTAEAPLLYNSPDNLLHDPAASLESLRAGELLNIQERIEQIAARNKRRAAWLDGIRVAALFSPLALLLGLAA